MSEAILPDIIVGVDTHKHTHAAVAITRLGARVGELTIEVSLGGYRKLETWARSLGAVRAFGIEGTEPPRVCRRLSPLRRWSHDEEEFEPLFP
jgi:hypothetical protein